MINATYNGPAQIFLVLILCLISMSSLEAQQFTPLHVDARVYKDSVTLTWTANDAAAWSLIRDGGITVERYELTADAPDLGPGTDLDWTGLIEDVEPVVYPPFYPADSLTFATNGLIGGGFTGAMGILLYDSLLNAGTDAELIALQQLEMVAFGNAFLADSVGPLLGARLEDGQLDTLGTYLYRIYVTENPEVHQEVAVSMLTGEKAVRYENVLTVDISKNPFADLLPPLPTNYPFQVRAKAFTDSIVVRWAPIDANLLRKSPTTHYLVTRRVKTDDAAGDALPAMDSTLVRPYSQAEIGAKINTATEDQEFILIAAQVLYGDLQSQAGTKRQEALDNQLAYGLQAADQSAAAATAMGLRYVDYDVEPGVEYIYQVTMNLETIDPGALPVTDGAAVVNTYEGPEELKGLSAYEGEFQISLLLDKANGNNYNQYFFERSDDGTNWRPLTERAVFFEVDEKLAASQRVYQLADSVSTLYQPFRYRVRGRNAFQEYSPWAEITAMARDRTPPPTSILAEPEMLTTRIVRLNWDAEMSETATDLAGYYVKMGHTPSPENQPIVTDLLAPGTTTYDFERPGVPFTNDSSYFFQIAAVDTAGNISSSFPVALRVIDSIPPAPPTGLQGTVDTNGIVTLLWEASPETDAAGYQVYFANDTTDTFVQVTKKDLIYNYFKDTIAVNTLTDAIYYRVSAFDRSYNNSDFSAILRVERPDVVAPTPPVLLQPKPTGEAVELTWKPSSSTDAVTYALLRRDPNDESGQWTVVDSLSAALTTYADTSAEFEVAYDYTLVTVDDAGLVSELANIQSGRRIFTADIGGVGEVTVELEGNGEAARPRVQWTYDKPTIDLLADAEYRFMLYRATGEDKLSRYKQLRGKEPVYLDQAVEPGTTYRYALMVVYAGGKKSGLSDAVRVTIPEKGR